MRPLALALVVALAAVLPLAAAEPARQLALHDAPVRVPDITFEDETGVVRSLADFRGRVVLLNVWATWCVPCRTEMPTLDRLQAARGGPDFEVLALSIDRAGAEVVRRFFGEIGIKHLAIRVDATAKAAFSLGAVGLPATLLIDRGGREIARLIGPAEWDAPEIVAVIDQAIAARRTDSDTKE